VTLYGNELHYRVMNEILFKWTGLYGNEWNTFGNEWNTLVMNEILFGNEWNTLVMNEKIW
jgi:hypothetical protein